MSAVSVTILISITSWDGLAPFGTAFEVNVLNVGTSVNDVSINALAALSSVKVLIECAKVKGITVGDTGQTPGRLLLGLAVTLVLGHLALALDGKHSVNNSVALNVLDIRVVTKLLDDRFVEVTGIALEAIADAEGMLHTGEELSDIRELAALAKLKPLLLALIVNVLNPAVVMGHSVVIDMILELDDVGVGDGISLNGGEYRGRKVVNGLDTKRRGLDNRRSGESKCATHDVCNKDREVYRRHKRNGKDTTGVTNPLTLMAKGG